MALAAGFGIEYVAGLGDGAPVPVWWSDVAYATAMAATAPAILPGAWKGLAHDRTLGINALIAFATLAAVALGEWSEGATVAVLFVVGEAIEGFTFARTRGAVSSLRDAIPATARVISGDGTARDVAVSEISTGTRVAVQPGGWIPIDGIVIEGTAAVNQAPLTGESLPVDRAPGDEVLAGTVNLDGFLVVETSRAFDATAVASIARVAGSALNGSTRNQRLIQHFARWYTPVVIALAVAVGFVAPLALGEPVTEWFGRALVLVLVACPCALLMAAPIAIVAAVGNASRHGVVIRSAAALEAAGMVDAVAFDKTGTITHGTLDVVDVLAVNPDLADETSVLSLAAAVEARSEHPVGLAIARAGAYSAHLTHGVDRFRAVAGSGVAAVVGGRAVMVGRAGWLTSLGIDVSRIEGEIERYERAGRRAVVVGAALTPGGEVLTIGTIALADRIRPEATEAIEALRAGRIRTVRMISGDAIPAAQSIAGAARIAPEDVRAGLMPDGKVAAVRELQSIPGVRAVAMVGDGINDAPALAAATVGIAIGSSSAAIAREAADVTIVSDDLRRVPWFLNLAARTRRTIATNVVLALGIKLVVLVLATLGYANLWLAIIADTGATVLVALNGSRLIFRGRGDVRPVSMAASSVA
jgi:Cd2+/Zn2+-exporting ATPase